MNIMKKVYYLSSCDTCKRIMKEVGVDDGFVQQDIKTEKMTKEELAEMAKRSGSYESLFSRRARQYAARGLKNQELSESDYESLILEEYTFLKRPVFLIGDDIFVGNNKKTVEAIKVKLNA